MTIYEMATAFLLHEVAEEASHMACNIWAMPIFPAAISPAIPIGARDP